MRKKRKTVWAFLDGKKLVDVVQAALDNNMMVDDLKAKLIAENPGHEVTFITPPLPPVQTTNGVMEAPVQKLWFGELGRPLEVCL